MIASVVVAVLLSLRIITLAQLRARGEGGSSSAFHNDLANCKYDDDGDCDDNNVLLCDTN